MTVQTLTPAEVRALQAAPLTYAEVGATRIGGNLPAGYRHLRRSRMLPAGSSWQAVTSDLLRWQVPQRARLRVRASSPVIAAGSVGVLSFGWGPASVHAPVRVVYSDRPHEDGDTGGNEDGDRCCFAYGTLPGHPEIGEEAFLVERRPDGRIQFTITAFSRPGTLATRLAGPIGAAIQSAATRRYLRSLDGAGA